MKLRFAMASLAMLFFVGCSGALHGTWVTEKVDPEDAQFKIAKVSFMEDNTFECTSEYAEGEPKTANGTYDFNGLKLTLTSGEEVREYDAYLCFGKLIVKKKMDDQTTTMTMAKEKTQ